MKSSDQRDRFNSIFSPDKKVSAAQYITEIICEKKAKWESGDTDLPHRFWRLKKWEKYYKFQIVIANRLLKKFRADAIINALEDKRNYKTYSLNSPVLKKIIQEYQSKPPPPPKEEKQKTFSPSETKQSKGVFRKFNSPLEEL